MENREAEAENMAMGCVRFEDLLAGDTCKGPKAGGFNRELTRRDANRGETNRGSPL